MKIEDKSDDGDLIQERTIFSHHHIFHIELENV